MSNDHPLETQRPAFVIGGEFRCGDQTWRCTDVGTRVITAICLDSVTVGGSNPALYRALDRAQATRDGWFNGPPYAVPEVVFDEFDQAGCTILD
jgi:hypothetical protein